MGKFLKWPLKARNNFSHDFPVTNVRAIYCVLTQRTVYIAMRFSRSKNLWCFLACLLFSDAEWHVVWFPLWNNHWEFERKWNSCPVLHSRSRNPFDHVSCWVRNKCKYRINILPAIFLFTLPSVPSVEHSLHCLQIHKQSFLHIFVFPCLWTNWWYELFLWIWCASFQLRDSVVHQLPTLFLRFHLNEAPTLIAATFNQETLGWRNCLDSQVEWNSSWK